jgi:hypothetical protein
VTYIYLFVVLYVVIMPLGWIHNLPREEAEKLANELGVSGQGTLDDLRRKVKDKWRAVETYLPTQIADKFGAGVDVAGVSNAKIQNADIHAQISYSQIKLKSSVVTDLVRKIPVLSDTEPENVFRFLVQAKELYDLNLVTDGEFLALLVTRMSGRLMQIISVHLRPCSGWGLVCSELLSSFLPPRIREGMSKYVLDRFQTSTEELSQFVVSVVVATNILDYQVPESVLVRRIVQNIHPCEHSQLMFASEPKSVGELHLLASQVAKGHAIDDQRKILGTHPPTANSQQDGRVGRPVSMAERGSSQLGSGMVKCWKCKGVGHVEKDCPSLTVPVLGRQGNGSGPFAAR